MESGWPDLPLDILGLVLGRLPSLADRVRLAAVCRRIRSSIMLLPQLPWVVLHDGTLLDLSSNVPMHQLPLPADASFYSAGENMLFLLHPDGRCCLVNALSGDTTHLPELAAVLRKYDIVQDDLRKVVMSKSSSPDRGPVIALLIGRWIILSTCRPAGETSSCLKAVVLALIQDIALFQGRLYALCGHRLFAFELPFDKPTPPGHKPESIGGNVACAQGLVGKQYNKYGMEQYLVESNGKLLLAAMVRIDYSEHDDEMQENSRKCTFEVWEADMSDSRRWKEVDGGLDGRALLVSFACSKSVPSAAATDDGLQQDCVYFIHHQLKERAVGSGVYDMRTKTSTPLPQGLTPLLRELTPPAEWGKIGPRYFDYGYKVNRRFPTWFFPNINATPPEGAAYGKGEVELTENSLLTEMEETVDAKPWRTCTTVFSLPYWMCKWDHLLPPSSNKCTSRKYKTD